MVPSLPNAALDVVKSPGSFCEEFYSLLVIGKKKEE